MIRAKPKVEAFGGIQTGERPSRAHDFVFVAERDVGQCALLLGSEVHDDSALEQGDETPAAASVLARADHLFLPLAEGTPTDRLERFDKGFRQVVAQTQRELQAGALDRTGEAPSLTVTLGYIADQRFYLGQVGHDASYLVRGGRMHRVTPEGPKRLPEGERPLIRDPRITNKELEVVGGFSDDLDVRTLAMGLEPGDVVLLCTRGVTASVPEPILEEALLAGCRDDGTSLEAVADAIFRVVPQHGRAVDRAIALARL